MKFIEEASSHEQKKARKLKVIFLDIDGVLLSEMVKGDTLQWKTHKDELHEILDDPEVKEKIPKEKLEEIKSKSEELKNKRLRPSYYNCLNSVKVFDKESVNNLIRLCKELDAKIVISSNWRTDKISPTEKISYDDLKLMLYPFSEYIIGATPDMEDRRHLEIEAWLLEHADEIDSYLILDDRERYGLDYHFGERFVLCNRYPDRLFASGEHYRLAYGSLSKSCDFDNCRPRLIWSGLENNATTVKQIEIYGETKTTLKLGFGYTDEQLITNLCKILADNDQVESLTLRNFNQDSDHFMNSVANLLVTRKKQLQELDLFNNNLTHIKNVLDRIDGKTVRVETFCLNVSYEEAILNSLDSWIRSYPSPIFIKFNSYELPSRILAAIESNNNVRYHIPQKPVQQDNCVLQ